jgi:formylglycine-generating enzyme required for sulfatase activity
MVYQPREAFLVSTSIAARLINANRYKIGITLVDIPAGSFMMGSCTVTSSMTKENKKRAFLGQAPLTANCSSADSDASDDETPQHRVSIRRFQMGKTEVTLGQFKQYIAAANRSDSGE